LARLYLMGGLRFDGPSGSFTDADLPGPQGRVTLAALAVERRAIARGELAEIVWDGRLPAKWEGALSTIVSKLRSLITAIGLDGKAVIATTGGTYALAPPADTWVDLEDAIRRLDRAEGALRHADLATATSEGTVASSILRRPFLAGIDGEWTDEQRRLQADRLYRSSITLARAWIDRADPALAATVAATAVRLDPLREIGHRLLIEAELVRGDRGAAGRALSTCERILAAELGVAPSPETLALGARIAG
jgi:DNA-binding SARP family transcriptional activator